jgi:hypothetical protein
LADRRSRVALLLCALLCATPASSFADWYVTPFVGVKFGGSTTLLDLEGSAGMTKMAIGGSVSLLSDGVLGLEGDYSIFPGFFQTDDPEPVVGSSRVQTLTGSVILAAPLGWTRESLRPYLVGGVGWMKATSDDLLPVPVLPVDAHLVALNLGVGAVGMLSDRAGLRFDLRRFSNLDRDTPAGFSFGSARLSFWRATVGVTFRY